MTSLLTSTKQEPSSSANQIQSALNQGIDIHTGTQKKTGEHHPCYGRKTQSDLSERHAMTLGSGNQLEIPGNARDIRRHSASDLGKTSSVVAQAIPEHDIVEVTDQIPIAGTYNYKAPRKSSAGIPQGKLC